jgi:TolB-like protein
MFQWAWAAFQRLPRWVRILVYAWAGIFLLSRLTPPHSDDQPPPKISATQAEKLRDLSSTHVGSWTAADTARLIAQIAKEVPGEAGDGSSTKAAVLAIPFAAPTHDPAAQKFAGSVFTQMYGRLAIARHGHVGLAAQPLATLDASAALAQGRARDSSYIVYGAVAGSGSDQRLTVKVIEVDDGSVAWSKSYPVTGADPAGIAAEVSANVPRDEDD